MKRVKVNGAIAVVLFALMGLLAGCENKDQPGETVPAPPRALIEKSYQGAKGTNPPSAVPGEGRRP